MSDNADMLLKLREDIGDVILAALGNEAGYSKTVVLMNDAHDLIEAMTASGGALRSKGEGIIVSLIERFDTTRGDSPWPLSKFLAEKEAAAARCATDREIQRLRAMLSRSIAEGADRQWPKIVQQALASGTETEHECAADH